MVIDVVVDVVDDDDDDDSDIFFLEETSNFISRRLLAETQKTGPMSAEPRAVKITAVRFEQFEPEPSHSGQLQPVTCGDRASFTHSRHSRHSRHGHIIIYYYSILYTQNCSVKERHPYVMTWKDCWPFTNRLILHSMHTTKCTAISCASQSNCEAVMKNPSVWLKKTINGSSNKNLKSMISNCTSKMGSSHCSHSSHCLDFWSVRPGAGIIFT